MKKETVENMENTLNECLDKAKATSSEDSFNNYVKAANSLATSLCDIDKLEAEKENNNKLWDKSTMMDLTKCCIDLLGSFIGIISLRSYARMVMQFEKDGILTTTPGKGLAGLFRFKPFI